MLNRFFKSALGIAQAPETTVAHTAHARAEGSAQIVDVRERNEWTSGHIPGSVHIPLGDLARRRQELDPARPVITVCRSGNRSLVAAEMLLRAGFVEVASMAGGIIAWANARQPVER